MRRHQQRQILELLQTMEEAQNAGLYADCQDGALFIGETIEAIIGEGTQTVMLLENAFKLLNANEGDRKIYKYLYKQVRGAIKIPREMLDFYYDDLRMRHFYTDEEIAGFRKKWERNIAD